MNITTVSASVRFSKDIGDRQYKTVELSAEGAVNANENWQTAQAQLYTDLGQQLKALWTTNGNGHVNNGHPEVTPEHYCNEHGTEFKRYEKEGRSWHAHKSGEAWCHEKSRNGQNKA